MLQLPFRSYWWSILLVTAIIGAVIGVRRRARRRGDATPGLHQHPERLDQMLDPTDDA